MIFFQTNEKASGQWINFDKSSLLFGKRFHGTTKESIKTVLGIQSEGGMGNYLGILKIYADETASSLPSLRKDYQMSSTWWLSKGGKEVMVKLIALALPIHVMSSFCFLWRFTINYLVSLHASGRVKTLQRERLIGWNGRICVSKNITTKMFFLRKTLVYAIDSFIKTDMSVQAIIGFLYIIAVKCYYCLRIIWYALIIVY